MTLTLVPLPGATASTTPDHNASVPRDGYGRPLVVPRGGGKPVALTRVTTYIDCIEDKTGLSDWKARSVLAGAASTPRIIEQACGLDVKADKAALDRLVERAADAAGASLASKRGTHIHDLSEYVDRGEPLPTHSQADADDMLAYMMGTAALETERIESFVVVPELRVGGTYDRTVRYSGPGPDGKHIEGRFIADLKTGSMGYGGIKMPSQLAIYSRGVSYDHTKFPVDTTDKKAFARWKRTAVPAEEAGAAYADPPPVSQEWGIIIHLPAGEATCTLHWADLTLGWEMAELAGIIRAARTRKGGLRPFAPIVSQVTPPGVDLG